MFTIRQNILTSKYNILSNNNILTTTIAPKAVETSPDVNRSQNQKTIVVAIALIDTQRLYLNDSHSLAIIVNKNEWSGRLPQRHIANMGAPSVIKKKLEQDMFTISNLNNSNNINNTLCLY